MFLNCLVTLDVARPVCPCLLGVFWFCFCQWCILCVALYCALSPRAAHCGSVLYCALLTPGVEPGEDADGTQQQPGEWEETGGGGTGQGEALKFNRR